jgi:hypothetical protein
MSSNEELNRRYTELYKGSWNSVPYEAEPRRPNVFKTLPLETKRTLVAEWNRAVASAEGGEDEEDEEEEGEEDNEWGGEFGGGASAAGGAGGGGGKKSYGGGGGGGGGASAAGGAGGGASAAGVDCIGGGDDGYVVISSKSDALAEEDLAKYVVETLRNPRLSTPVEPPAASASASAAAAASASAASGSPARKSKKITTPFSPTTHRGLRHSSTASTGQSAQADKPVTNPAELARFKSIEAVAPENGDVAEEEEETETIAREKARTVLHDVATLAEVALTDKYGLPLEGSSAASAGAGAAPAAAASSADPAETRDNVFKKVMVKLKGKRLPKGSLPIVALLRLIPEDIPADDESLEDVANYTAALIEEEAERPKGGSATSVASGSSKASDAASRISAGSSTRSKASLASSRAASELLVRTCYTRGVGASGMRTGDGCENKTGTEDSNKQLSMFDIGTKDHNKKKQGNCWICGLPIGKWGFDYEHVIAFLDAAFRGMLLSTQDGDWIESDEFKILLQSIGERSHPHCNQTIKNQLKLYNSTNLIPNDEEIKGMLEKLWDGTYSANNAPEIRSRLRELYGKGDKGKEKFLREQTESIKARLKQTLFIIRNAVSNTRHKAVLTFFSRPHLFESGKTLRQLFTENVCAQEKRPLCKPLTKAVTKEIKDYWPGTSSLGGFYSDLVKGNTEKRTPIAGKKTYGEVIMGVITEIGARGVATFVPEAAEAAEAAGAAEAEAAEAAPEHGSRLVTAANLNLPTRRKKKRMALAQFVKSPLRVTRSTPKPTPTPKSKRTKRFTKHRKSRNRKNRTRRH